MEGGDLLKYLVKRKQYTGAVKACLSEDEARHVFHQVVSAISYAHNQHICHRDLKLENILLKDNTLATVKIADFGLSDFYRPGAMIKSNCGTLSFLAPEVFKGTANAGPPLDVWALGVILFALLCGRLPFEGPDLIGTKRPRDAVIRSRITKCQYKIDDNLGPEAKVHFPVNIYFDYFPCIISLLLLCIISIFRI
jgi:serine/threonine protein kinase